tara:strand:- start:5083 stop:6000 length:918 start_codon:yes stop_codon:yes gene_type:complete
MNNSKNIIMLDGGMGQELIHRSKKKPDSLWSARVLMDEFDLVVDLHKDFVNAGASIISLNSYAVTPQRLARHNLEENFLSLQNKAIYAALKAKNESPNSSKLKIAGCLPPLVGSYQTKIGLDDNVALDTYKRMIEIQENSVDFFICETMSSIKEANLVKQASIITNKPIWMSFCLDEENGNLLRSKETLIDAIDNLNDNKISAFLVNCSPPEAIKKAIPVLKISNKPIGILPNGFKTTSPLTPDKTVESLEKRADFTKNSFYNFVKNCVEEEIVIVGGCCEVSPEFIKNSFNKLSALGYNFVNKI